jgi:hypothetical protein
MKSILRPKLATVFLLLGMFFSPLGFDAVQYILIKLTGSLFGANLALYFLAAFCFGLYFIFSGYNPLFVIKESINSVYKRLILRKNIK